MSSTRVLAVDDTATARRILREILDAWPGIECAGTASTAELALAKARDLAPDLVVVAVDMESGAHALELLKRELPALPVIATGRVRPDGSSELRRALALGAREFIPQPEPGGEGAAAHGEFGAELATKIRSLVASARNQAGVSSPSLEVTALRPRLDLQRVDCVAIGVSTGGPNALQAVLPQLPADLPVPIVVVQHMPAGFTRTLADALNAASALEVCEAKEGDELAAGRVLVAPGDRHLVLERRGVRVCASLDIGAPENYCRPSVDVLFRSVAEVYGGGALAVVLTGMGHDGLLGARAIVAAGGACIAQDESSSVVWGMPGAVARAGLCSRVLPLSAIAREIQRCARSGVVRPESAPRKEGGP